MNKKPVAEIEIASVEDVTETLAAWWPKPEELGAHRQANLAAEIVSPLAAHLGKVIRSETSWQKQADDYWLLPVLGMRLFITDMKDGTFRPFLGVAPCAVNAWPKGLSVASGHDNFVCFEDAREACVALVRQLYAAGLPYDFLIHYNREPEFPIEDMTEPVEPIIVHVPAGKNIH